MGGTTGIPRHRRSEQIRFIIKKVKKRLIKRNIKSLIQKIQNAHPCLRGLRRSELFAGKGVVNIVLNYNISDSCKKPGRLNTAMGKIEDFTIELLGSHLLINHVYRHRSRHKKGDAVKVDLTIKYPIKYAV